MENAEKKECYIRQQSQQKTKDTEDRHTAENTETCIGLTETGVQI